MSMEDVLEKIREAQAKRSQAEKELEVLIGQKQEILEPVNQWIRECSQIKTNIEAEIWNFLLTLKRYREEYSENELEAKIKLFKDKIGNINELIKKTNDDNLLKEYNDILSYYKKQIGDLCLNLIRSKEALSIDIYIISISQCYQELKKERFIFDSDSDINKQIETIEENKSNVIHKFETLKQWFQSCIKTVKDVSLPPNLSSYIPKYNSEIKQKSIALQEMIDSVTFNKLLSSFDKDDYLSKVDEIDRKKQEINKQNNDIIEKTVKYGKKKLNKFSSNVKSYIWVRIIFNVLLAVIVLVSAIWALPECRLAEKLLDCCDCEVKCCYCIVIQTILFLFFTLLEVYPINKLCKVGKINLLINSYISDLKVTVDFATTHSQIKEIFNSKYEDFIEEIKNESNIFKRESDY